MELLIVFFGFLGNKIGKYLWHFSHSHLNGYYHPLPFYIFDTYPLILPLYPLHCIWTTFISISSICFSLVPTLPIPCFYDILILVYILQCFPCYVSWELSWLILILVGMRDIRLITTSFPCNRGFPVNRKCCQITVTFQVQGTITMWLILTQNWSDQKTPNLLSKLPCLLLFQRLLIQWHSFITCEC